MDDVDVDVEAFETLKAVADWELHMAGGGPENDALAGAPVSIDRDLPPADGESAWWGPQSWSHQDCNGDGENDTHWWNTDGRTLIQDTSKPDHTDRQSTVVYVNIDMDGNGTFEKQCTGFSVRQDRVVTAAHCTFQEGTGGWLFYQRFQVCRDDLDPDVCMGVNASNFAVHRAPGYSYGSNGWDPADDWAVLELEDTWTGAGYAATETMHLSSASNNTLGALTNTHNLGFPGSVDGFSCNPGLGMYHNQENEPIAGIWTKQLRLKTDGTTGHSGGPVYFCPMGDDNVCAAGDPAVAIMVWGGWSDCPQCRFAGPKIPWHRNDMLLAIDG